MANNQPMVTQGVSILSPASTYPDILFINNAGQGLNNNVSQLQDGLGNNTLMTLSSNFINFDRSVAEFQLDGVALTANAATLNNISDVANAQYLLLTPNAQLSSAATLQGNNGISLTTAGSVSTIAPTPGSALGGLQNFSITAPTTGFLIYQAGNVYSTVMLQSNGTMNITNPNGVAGNPVFSVLNDTSLQQVIVDLNGINQSQRSTLNFINGSGIGLNIQDNAGLNRTDITISSTGGGGGGILPVMNGGTGVDEFVPYSVIIGGTTDISPLQSIATVGVAGQVLTSGGPGMAPSWVNTGAASSTVNVMQAAHGFVVGNVIQISAATSTYIYAQADNATDATCIVGIVTEVTDANNFMFQYAGILTILTGLTTGAPYFLSPTVPGGYTTTSTTTQGQIVAPLFFALSATTALWQPQSPYVFS
jgi:hypothetical protein